MYTDNQTEKLTKAVIDLTKRFKKSEELAKQPGILAKMTRGMASVNGSIKERVADAFSLKGVGSVLGLNQGGMIGQYLAGRDEKLKQDKISKRADAMKAKRFAENFSKYTEQGQGLDEQAALKKGVQLYQEQKRILEEIKNIKQEINDADEVGQGDIVKKNRSGDIADLEKRLASLYDVNRPESAKFSKSEASKVADALMTRGNVLDSAASSLEKQNGGPISKEDRASLGRGIKAGMVEELLKSNEQQVTELRKLVQSSEKTEEEMLESKIKATPGAVKPIQEIKKEEKNGIFDIIGNLFGSVRDLIPGLNSLLKFIPSVIAAGSTLLSFMASPITIAAVAAFTTLALLGREKTKEGDGSVEKFADTSVLAGAFSAGASGTEGAAIMATVEENPQTPAEIREFNKKNNELLKDAPFLTRVYGYKAKEYIAEKQRADVTAVSRATTTVREAQSNSLEQNRQAAMVIEKAKAESKTSSPSTNVITTTNVKNSTSVTKLSPPTRNIDPTYNDRLSFGSPL